MSLKRLGQRENRWMTDVNHQVSKALVDRYGGQTLFVWAFYQLQQMIEYKAALQQARTVAVDPRYTS
ncbi:MAG: hypothetical protein M0Z36_04520 [Thermaerobacter sp.]|nr:hypothetical protein [Thermaerobacter sp.]